MLDDKMKSLFHSREYEVLRAFPVQNLSLWRRRFLELQKDIGGLLEVDSEDPEVRTVLLHIWGSYLTEDPVWLADVKKPTTPALRKDQEAIYEPKKNRVTLSIGG